MHPPLRRYELFRGLFCLGVLGCSYRHSCICLLMTCMGGFLGVHPTRELPTCGVCVGSVLRDSAKLFCDTVTTISTRSSGVSVCSTSRPKLVSFLSFCQNSRCKMVTLCVHNFISLIINKTKHIFKTLLTFGFLLL